MDPVTLQLSQALQSSPHSAKILAELKNQDDWSQLMTAKQLEPGVLGVEPQVGRILLILGGGAGAAHADLRARPVSTFAVMQPAPSSQAPGQSAAREWLSRACPLRRNRSAPSPRPRATARSG